MIASFDASMLILLFDRHAAAPKDGVTGKPVEKCQERLTYLLQTISKTRGSRLIFPVPALAEFLVRIDPQKAADYLGQIQRLRGSIIAPFDIRSAIDFAEMQRSVVFERVRRVPKGELESRSKAKFDQQIVAISKTHGASVIYTDDQRLGTFAKRFGIAAIGIAALPMSPESRQGVLPLEPPEPAAPPPATDKTD